MSRTQTPPADQSFPALKPCPTPGVFRSPCRRTSPSTGPAPATAQRPWLSEFSGLTMTRSILWISSSAPSSLLPTGWVALPQPIQDGIGGGNLCGGGGIRRSHHADQDIERGPGIAARQRSDFSDGLSHFLNRARVGRRMEEIDMAPCRCDPWSRHWANASNEGSRLKMHGLSFAIEP
jgi:hypothetical protein